MSSLDRRGLGGLIESYAGCFAPKFVNRDPTAMLSHHAWGIAFDCNFPGNAYGEPPHQDPRLVRTMERFGFIWGGTFIVPDGNHFEYRRSPAATDGRATVQPAFQSRNAWRSRSRCSTGTCSSVSMPVRRIVSRICST